MAQQVADEFKDGDGGFVIEINAGKDVKSSSIKAYGETESIITDKSFGALFAGSSLDKSRCKGTVYDYVNKYHGKKPNDIYAKSKTPWGDLYTTYKWTQMKSKVKIYHTRLLIILKICNLLHKN